MKEMYRAALIVAAFVLFLPLPVRSEIRAGSFEITPFAGYHFFETNQNLKDRPVFGGRLGYNFTKYFGVEVGAVFIDTGVNNRTKTDLAKGQFGSPMSDVDIIFYNIDAVYHFLPNGIITPYISAGIGGARYSPSISTKDMTTFDFGLGAKVWMTNHIALRLDCRDYMVSEVFQESYHNLEVTLGIVIALGGKARSGLEPAAAAKPVSRADEMEYILAPDPKVEQKVMVAATKPEIIALAFEDVHFDFNKSTLKPEAEKVLERNIEILKKYPATKIRIAGYTSASGSKEYNQKLSEKRANSVRDFLIKKGSIGRDRLLVIGYGQTRPKMHEGYPENIFSEAAEANRRVLFWIVVE